MTEPSRTPFSPDAIARVCHEANRALQAVTGDPAPSAAWDDTDTETRRSAVEGVLAALDGATPEQLHESWSQFKLDAGWVYGPLKNAETKTHPCLVDYADLPEEQRAKDALFHGIVKALG